VKEETEDEIRNWPPLGDALCCVQVFQHFDITLRYSKNYIYKKINCFKGLLSVAVQPPSQKKI
jgi:hypothetical protein